MSDPLSDIVSSQYEKWMYPKPILDLGAWLKDNWQWFDPSHAHRIFWPDQDYRPDLDILIAGCGTNQAAVFAYNNPQAKVVAIDVSQPSLDHHRFLIDKYQMDNLELHLIPIEEVSKLNRDFDLIVSTGVLHHLADPQKGLQSLSKHLRQEGVMALMLYARYGRIGVEILQSVTRDLGLLQNDTSVDFVKQLLGGLSEDHPIKSYMKIAPDLQYDAGLVDTFLHGRDNSFSIDDSINLVKNADLVFQDIFFKAPYYPLPHLSSGVYSAISALPHYRQWSIMERINTTNACHFFTVCRKDRPEESYKIDFKSADCMSYIPKFRYRCSLVKNLLSRPGWSSRLSESEAMVASEVDGKKTIAQIAFSASKNVTFKGDLREMEDFCKTFFQRLWQLDFMAICFGPT